VSTHRISTDKFLALDSELRDTVAYLETGLAQIWEVDGANTIYSVPFASLAQGLERLMKLVLGLAEFERSGDLTIPRKELRRSHDLAQLCKAVCLELKTSALPQDAEYMCTDEQFGHFLSILSDFAVRDRYRNRDILSGTADPQAVDAIARFDLLKLEFLKAHPQFDPSTPGFASFYQAMKEHLTRILQRFIRALSRAFTMGGLGREGRRFGGRLHPWVFMMEEGLTSLSNRK